MTKGRFKIARCGMNGVEAVSADTSHAFGRHTHDQFGIGIILRGAQKSMSGRGVVEAEAGDLITVNPGEVHDGFPLDENGSSWQVLYFNPSALTDTFLTLTEGSTDHTELAHPAIRALQLLNISCHFLAL